MKKLIVSVALLLCVAGAKCEIVARDTVEYAGTATVEKVEKTNDYGEISVRYVAVLHDVTNKKGEPRKVATDKAAYKAGKITHLVYNTQDSGSKKIAKAIYLEGK